MAASLADWVGMLAGVLTTVAFVPQVVKTWRTRQTRDISLSMWLLFSVGLVLWTAYGVMMQALPIVAANVVTLALAGTVLAIKLGNRGKE